MSPMQREAVAEWLGNSAEIDRFFGSDDEEISQSHSGLVSIVLSHRERHIEQSSDIRQAIDNVLAECHREAYRLLVSDETPLGPYLLYRARRQQVAIELIKTPKSAKRMQATVPWIDRALVAIPDRVFVITCANNSKTFQTLQRRLTDSRFPIGSVFIDIGATLSDEDAISATPSESRRANSKDRSDIVAREELVAAGAVLRLRKKSHTVESRQHWTEESRTTITPFFHSLPIESSNSETLWSYLTHCTRARNGPWPDQSLAGYRESLELETVEQTPFASLRRILQQQRLIATSHLKRDSVSSVSFSAVPLRELLARRRYRSHLGRWDWEPYGICVKRSYIEALGGKAVSYGDEATLSELSPSERPFFQVLPTIREVERRLDHATSLASELEWRLTTDLHLASIPFDQAFIFVPTQEEATKLQSISRFSILCLNRKTVVPSF